MHHWTTPHTALNYFKRYHIFCKHLYGGMQDMQYSLAPAKHMQIIYKKDLLEGDNNHLFLPRITWKA